MHNRVVHEVDLNADLGEEVTDDAALLRVVTSANVACGYHAGSPEIMREVCVRAAAGGVQVGAQVSYLDREGFGRRTMDVPRVLLAAQVREQVDLLSRIARESGTAVGYVKPHGALYNRVVDDEEQARAVLDGSGDLPVLGLPGGRLLALARGQGRTVVEEAFPDRGYDETGRLLPRDRDGAVFTDPEEIAARALGMAEQADSLCVHGDGSTAVAAAHAVRSALEQAGFTVRPFAPVARG